jgi:hypothetical protein
MTFLIIDSINGKTIRETFVKAADRESAQESYLDSQTGTTGDLRIFQVAA